jgi:transmembrane sensor
MESMIARYKDYSVNDFVWDEQFVAWCKNMPGADSALWKTVLETYPELGGDITSAKDFLAHVSIVDHELSAGQAQNIWQGIERELQISRPVVRVRALGWLRVAAVLLLVAGASLITYYATSGKEEVQTQYAEIKQLELPDGSKVALNANSVISYSKEWDTSKPREVWLNGEAFFDVSHLHKGNVPVRPGQRFIVHANGVDVEVLGTSFNINNRHGAAKIMLSSGSIELKFTDKKMANILMKPGEVVNYAEGAKKIEKRVADVAKASAWKEHRWEFENAPLKDVLQLLKDNYGLETVVEDSALWQKTISGTISSDNKDIVIRGLSVLLDTEIEQKDKSLLLKK